MQPPLLANNSHSGAAGTAAICVVDRFTMPFNIAERRQKPNTPRPLRHIDTYKIMDDNSACRSRNNYPCDIDVERRSGNKKNNYRLLQQQQHYNCSIVVTITIGQWF